VSKEPDLLDGWWTSEYLYSLERRAIFSKASFDRRSYITWICIAHRSRFTKPGDYISMELAGFPILIILGKDNIARAFHNVCRHRAYTITKKPSGSSLVLGCRYHGWSYNSKGDLVRAPHFDGVEGFNKSENGLFKIKTCTDKAGFIHINLEAGDLSHVPDCEEILEFANDFGINAQSTWLLGFEMNGAFNWKTIGIGTPAFSVGSASFMELVFSMFRRSPLNVDSGKMLYLAPSATVVAFPKSPMWATLTTLPGSATSCTIRCDVYSSKPLALKSADVGALKAYFNNYKEALEQSYFELKTTSPTEQPSLLPHLKTHLKLERLAGREIFPGRKEEGRSESFCRAE
ncbi:ISP domain-containing protein, partial [Lojkania enalia]